MYYSTDLPMNKFMGYQFIGYYYEESDLVSHDFSRGHSASQSPLQHSTISILDNRIFLPRQPFSHSGHSPSYLRQPFPNVGLSPSYLGQPFPNVGQSMSDLGRPFSGIGRKISDYGLRFTGDGNVHSGVVITLPKHLSGASSQSGLKMLSDISKTLYKINSQEVSL